MMYVERHNRWGISFLPREGFGEVIAAMTEGVVTGANPGSLTFLNRNQLFSGIVCGELHAVLSALDDGGVWNVNIRLADGTTPLHLAARLGHARIIKALLEHHETITDPESGRTWNFGGAETGARDAQGRTPLDVARSAGHLDAVALLENAGEVTSEVESPSSVDSPTALCRIESGILRRTVRALRDAFELTDLRPPLRSLVFVADEMSCVVTRINAPALARGRIEKLPRLGSLLEGAARVEGAFVREGDTAEVCELTGLSPGDALMTLMHRVCARLELDRALWGEVRLARAVRAFFIDHFDDAVYHDLRSLARRTVHGTIEAYFAAAGPRRQMARHGGDEVH